MNRDSQTKSATMITNVDGQPAKKVIALPTIIVGRSMPAASLTNLLLRNPLAVTESLKPSRPSNRQQQQEQQQPTMGSGVYFRNKELSKTLLHPLQTPPSSSSLSSSLPPKKRSHVTALPITGKPMSPAPVLGHLKTLANYKSSGGKIHFEPPVKVGKTIQKGRSLHKLLDGKKALSPEEALFVEAAASLRKGYLTPSPTAIRARLFIEKKGKSDDTNGKKSADSQFEGALPPPPFSIACKAA